MGGSNPRSEMNFSMEVCNDADITKFYKPPSPNEPHGGADKGTLFCNTIVHLPPVSFHYKNALRAVFLEPIQISNRGDEVFKVPEVQSQVGKKGQQPSSQKNASDSLFAGSFFSTDSDTTTFNSCEFSFSNNDSDDFFASGFGFNSPQPKSGNNKHGDPLTSIFGYSPLKPSSEDDVNMPLFQM